ncbi:MAG: ABC transporter permease [Candidatus Muiribacteriota bacterium]
MNIFLAFWTILKKDMKAYYLKPPNISWGLIFPVAWTSMFYLRSGSDVDVIYLLAGVCSLSILFGATSMLAVTVTFEKKNNSFNRLLLAPLPYWVLMISKISGAVLFGVINAFIPVILALFITQIPSLNWVLVFFAFLLASITSSLVGLFVAVSVSEVFEAQTFSNFLRFPMIFLCGLFIPLNDLPSLLRPVSYILPLTYSVDILHTEFSNTGIMPVYFNLLILLLFTLILSVLTLKNIKRKWII